jgi:hypothetical protein
MNSRSQLLDKWRISTARLLVLALLLALNTAVYSPLWAVDCKQLIIALQTQAEVDSFQDTFGPCDRVLTLYIEGADITNLDGLSALTDVGASLYIENNPVLTNVDGLSSLTGVARNLWIQNNVKLTHLNGLSALISVGDKLVIIENSALTDIDGLSALTDVGGTMGIRDNAVLTDVNGLLSLTSVGGSELADQQSLVIENNPALTNLDGLSALTSVGHFSGGYAWMVINNNAALTDIDGLSALTGIWGDLIITNNAELVSINGLDALTRVIEIIIQNNPSLINVDGLSALTNTSKLLISDNDGLTNVDGLSAMTAIWHDLEIQKNAMLGQCAGLARLLDQWDDAEPGPGDGDIPDVGGEVIIGGNLEGCNSIQEILASTDISRINAGLNDAWYNPATDGQGFFITVFPDLGAVSLAWFTYDTELPPEDATARLGDPGHRWLTALGPITGNQVLMDIEMTSGGIFDTPSEIQRTDPSGSDGTILLTFTSCNSGTVEYDIRSINRQASVPIMRVANDNISLCEALNSN